MLREYFIKILHGVCLQLGSIHCIADTHPWNGNASDAAYLCGGPRGEVSRWPLYNHELSSFPERMPLTDASLGPRHVPVLTKTAPRKGRHPGEACLKGGGWKGGGTHLNRLLRHQKQLPHSERKTTPNRERLSSRSCLPRAHKLSKRNKIPSLVYLHINPSEMQSLPTPLLPYYLVINKTYPLHHQCIFPAAGHKRDS